MEKLPKYKQVEGIVFGGLLPLCLVIYTAFLLINNEAVFWGRGSTVLYHGTSAYFVSLLWFGIAGLLVNYFVLYPLRIAGKGMFKFIIGLSLVSVVVGLLSAMVLM